jgi:hypothetical protein
MVVPHQLSALLMALYRTPVALHRKQELSLLLMVAVIQQPLQELLHGQPM